MSDIVVFLETERLILRWFNPDDIDLVIELDSDPEVMRFINDGLPVDLVEVNENLDWWLTQYDRAGGYGFWAMVEKATGRFVG